MAIQHSNRLPLPPRYAICVQGKECGAIRWTHPDWEETEDWKLCNGQRLSILLYPQIHKLLHDSGYDCNVSTTEFCLPNMCETAEPRAGH